MIEIEDIKDKRFKKEILKTIEHLASETLKELRFLDSLNLATKNEEKWLIYIIKNELEKKVRKRANVKFI